MNKKIICIESPDFKVNALKRLADENGDKVFLFTSDPKRVIGQDVFYVDVRKDYYNACKIIRNKIGQPDAIITSQEMFINQTALLAEEFGVIKDPIDVINIFREKSKMKEIWLEKGVNTPKGRFYSSFKQLEGDSNDFSFPVIVKPSSGYASFGVKKVYSIEELRKQLKKIALLNSTVVSRENISNKGFVIEDYIDGDEYSIDTIWYKGEAICSGILSKGNSVGPYFPDRLYFVDPLIEKETKKKIIDISSKAIRAIGLKFGATHTEIRFKGGEPFVLETTCRPGAGGIFYDLFKMALGMDFYRVYYSALVLQDEEFLFKTIKYSPSLIRSSFWYNIPHKGQGVIESINGIEELKMRREIVKVLCYKSPGAILYQDDLNTDYFCSVLGYHNTNENLNQLINDYDNTLEVIYR